MFYKAFLFIYNLYNLYNIYNLCIKVSKFYILNNMKFRYLAIYTENWRYVVLIVNFFIDSYLFLIVRCTKLQDNS